MGWLFMPFTAMAGHASAKSYLDAQFTYDQAHEDGTRQGLEILASSCPGNRVYYAAAQLTTNGVPGDVFAIICLIRWNPRSADGHQFGYKSMDESAGPCEAQCPARILDLLTPTDREYANDWRARCRVNLALRSRRLADGDLVRFSEPMTFSDGHVAREFQVIRDGRRIILRAPETGGLYRVSRFMERDWSIVPKTRVHATLFS